MEAQAHALRELDQLRRVELVVELGLPRQDDAQHLVLGGLHAREHADLLEHLVAEVLRLVDDQQHLAAVGVLLDQEIVERREHLGLPHLEGLEAELHQHALQELDRRHLRLVDLADHHVLLQLAQEGFDQRGLARADFPGDDDEAVGEPDGRLHVRLGARMVLAQVQELRVRTEAERQLVELEEMQIHAGDSLRESRNQREMPRLRRGRAAAHAPFPGSFFSRRCKCASRRAALGSLMVQ